MRDFPGHGIKAESVLDPMVILLRINDSSRFIKMFKCQLSG